MSSVRNYPASLDEVIRDVKYKRETLAALRRFKRSNPWKGTFPVRLGKFIELHSDLCDIYGVNIELFIDPSILENSHSGRSNFNPALNTITLYGKLSVLTFLHEWGHVLKGSSEYEACIWSVNLFRRVFPDNFNRLRDNARGHFLAA
jgi:hypothetical protein